MRPLALQWYYVYYNSAPYDWKERPVYLMTFTTKLCRMEGSGAAKRAEGNVEHDTAQAKQYTEGAADGIIGGITPLPHGYISIAWVCLCGVSNLTALFMPLKTNYCYLVLPKVNTLDWKLPVKMRWSRTVSILVCCCHHIGMCVFSPIGQYQYNITI